MLSFSVAGLAASLWTQPLVRLARLGIELSCHGPMCTLQQFALTASGQGQASSVTSAPRPPGQEASPEASANSISFPVFCARLSPCCRSRTSSLLWEMTSACMRQCLWKPPPLCRGVYDSRRPREQGLLLNYLLPGSMHWHGGGGW